MKILVFIGPSGSGKSTLVRELHRQGVITALPSWTTRSPREDDVGDYVDHRFVSEQEFAELERAGHFLETVEMFGSRYGLPPIESAPDDPIPAIVIRAPLLELVAEHFPDHVIYQIESDFETVRERIQERGLDPETEARLRAYADEIPLGRKLCDRVFYTAGEQMMDVVDAVRRAIAKDFLQESLLSDAERRKNLIGATLTGFVAVAAMIAGLVVVGYFLLMGIALMSFGSNK